MYRMPDAAGIIMFLAPYCIRTYISFLTYYKFTDMDSIVYVVKDVLQCQDAIAVKTTEMAVLMLSAHMLCQYSSQTASAQQHPVLLQRLCTETLYK